MSGVVTENLSRVANRLNELGIVDVVFVGGATIGLFLTDPAAPEPRATYDVDVITPVTSRAAYNALEQILHNAGYEQPREEGDPICRWRIDGVTVDLMPPDEAVLGFSNRWYPDILEHAQATTLPDGTKIRLVTTPYLIASKLEAFRGRGRDYRSSHDLEDIVILLDGRDEVIIEMQQAPEDVRTFVAAEFQRLLEDEAFVEAVPGYLYPDAASQARAPSILSKIKELATTKS